MIRHLECRHCREDCCHCREGSKPLIDPPMMTYIYIYTQSLSSIQTVPNLFRASQDLSQRQAIQFHAISYLFSRNLVGPKPLKTHDQTADNAFYRSCKTLSRPRTMNLPNPTHRQIIQKDFQCIPLCGFFCWTLECPVYSPSIFWLCTYEVC